MPETSLYRYYRERGFCVDCRHEPAMVNQVRCPDCAEKQARRTAEYRAKRKLAGDAAGDDIRREARRAQYAQRVADGVCVDCGSRKARPGYTRCVECLGRRARKARQKAGYGDIRRAEYVAHGLCHTCGKPVKPGKGLCEKHYRAFAEQVIAPAHERQRKLKAENPFYGHIWRQLDRLVFARKGGRNDKQIRLFDCGGVSPRNRV